MMAFAVWLSCCAALFALVQLADGVVYNRRNDPGYLLSGLNIWLTSFFTIAAALIWIGVFVEYLSDAGFIR